MLLEKIKLEKDEKILTQVRRHWFVITMKLLSLALVALLPLPVMFVLNYLLADNANLTINLFDYTAGLIFFYSIWLLLTWFSAFSVWTNYYLDILTVTDRRAILINQRGFFRRHVTSFRLERLQDMNIEINGLIPTVLDFGHLSVETAGHSDEEFHAPNVPKPRELKGLILQAADVRMGATPDRTGVE